MSMGRRQDLFRKLQARTGVPVLVLGGGINGVGLYRELALQGVDCVLVDQADFCAGATSKSSRMIHGGLRYLENREFKLVSEALIERNRLIENAGHYVAPLKTTIPLSSWFGGLIRSGLIFAGLNVSPGERGVLPVKLGLMFYDFITRKNRRTPTHFLTSKAESLRRMPGLRRNIVATATYWDAWITQAERLCIELIQDAQSTNPNCLALNYVKPQGLADGAVLLEDRATGQTAAIRPKVLVNATGAWVDFTNATLGLRTRFMGGTKGSHLVVNNPALHRALDGQMVYYQYRDGRVCIVLPFLDKVIMGSTDIRVEDPGKAHCGNDEIEYMLSALRGVFPEIEIRREEIVFVYCGVRPLPFADGVTANISRGHSVRAIPADAQRPFPLYSLIGGKWTTFRAFAEQVADRVLRDLGQARRCGTQRMPIGGGQGLPGGAEARRAWTAKLAGEKGLPVERAEALVARYGSRAGAWAIPGDAPLRTLPGYTAGEIRRIVSGECVERLTDLICRRSLIALMGEARPEVLAELAEVAGELLGWDASRKKREVDEALAEVRVPE